MVHLCHRPKKASASFRIINDFWWREKTPGFGDFTFVIFHQGYTLYMPTLPGNLSHSMDLCFLLLFNIIVLLQFIFTETIAHNKLSNYCYVTTINTEITILTAHLLSITFSIKNKYYHQSP